MSKKLIAFALVIALIGVAGCGGDDETSGSTETAAVTLETNSLSKAEFVNQASKLCRARVLPLQEQVAGGISGELSVDKVEAVVLPAIEGVIADLEELGAPKAQQADAEAMLSALQEDAENAQQAPSSSMEAFAAKFKTSGEQARKLGIESCAFG
jgi:hypothetical protein